MNEFMIAVKEAIEASLNHVKQSPLFIWDADNNQLIYKGNPNDRLVPMIKNRNDEYIKTKKYCK